MRHTPVLLQETLDALHLSVGNIVVDCTLGDAGHTEKIVEQLGPEGKVLGIDVDPEAILRAKHFLHEYGDRVIFIRKSFSHLSEILKEQNIAGVHAILMDLGWSTPQFEERGRGFSFLKPEEPLDMRLSADTGITAAELLATVSEEQLAYVLRVYGEEPLAKEIAGVVIQKRQDGPIEKVADFVECVLLAYRKKLKTDKEVPWIGGLHPATKSFQALRIAVNNELDVLEESLPQAIDALLPGGRLAVISFHSLEDRVVKHFFKSQKNIRFIHKKPLVCGDEEYRSNPRARSAKLRVVEKI